MQYWDGSAWATTQAVNGNDRALRVVTFPDVTTDRIRIFVRNGREHFSRVIEVEAFGCTAP